MKQIIFALIVLLATTMACKKQKEVSIDKTIGEADSYIPLSVGNYWVYNVSNVDTAGNSSFIGYDSTYIAADTLIHGDKFFVFKSGYSSSYVQYLRDSAHYYIDEKGERFFNADAIDDTLHRSITKTSTGNILSVTYRIMKKPLNKISCLQGSYFSLDAESIRFLPFLNLSTKSHTYYAPNIGLILWQDYPRTGLVKTYSLHHYYLVKAIK